MLKDFGLAHAAQSGAGMPAYMLPEQLRADARDVLSDIYAYVRTSNWQISGGTNDCRKCCRN